MGSEPGFPGLHWLFELFPFVLTSQVESQGDHARTRKFLLAGLMKINTPVDLAGVSFEFSSVFQLVQRDVLSKPLDLVVGGE